MLTSTDKVELQVKLELESEMVLVLKILLLLMSLKEPLKSAFISSSHRDLANS